MSAVVTIPLDVEPSSASGDDVVTALESLLARAKRGELLSLVFVSVAFASGRSNRNSAQKDNR